MRAIGKETQEVAKETVWKTESILRTSRDYYVSFGVCVCVRVGVHPCIEEYP